MKINKLLYIALVSMMMGFMPLISNAGPPPLITDCDPGFELQGGVCVAVGTRTIPEPSTLGLLLLGAAGIWIARRKSK